MNDLSSKFQSLKAQITSFRHSISQESEKIENLYGGYELATKEASLRAKIREFYYVKWKNALFMKLIKQKHTPEKSISSRNNHQEFHTRDINIADQNSYRASSIQDSSNYEHPRRSRIPPKIISKKYSPVIDEPPAIRVKRPERSITLTSSDDEESEIVIKARQLLLNTNNAIEAMNAKKNPPPRNTFAERLEKIKLKPLSPKNSPEKQKITQIQPPSDSEKFTKQERSILSNSDDENLQVSPYASDEEMIDISPYATESDNEKEVIQISPYNSESEEEEIKIQISPYQSESDEDDIIDKIHDSELLGSNHVEIKKKIEKEFDEIGISSNLASTEKPDDVSSYKFNYNVSNVESEQGKDYQISEFKVNEPQISEITNEDNEEEEDIPESQPSYNNHLTINDVISVDDYDVPKEGGELPPDLSSIQSFGHEVFNNENEQHYNMDSLNDAESDGTMTTATNNTDQAGVVENIKIEENEEEMEDENFSDDEIKLPDEQDIDGYNDDQNKQDIDDDLNQSKEIADEILKNPVVIPKPTPPKETKPLPIQSQQNIPVQQQNISQKSDETPKQVIQEDDDEIFVLQPTNTREIHLDDEKTEEKDEIPQKQDPNDIESMPVIDETDLDDPVNQDTDIPVISLD
ncbi:hypothetical protein TVAG_184020 [Trichomonas vaginalis G3]|uniref:Uncharacterized protein n=1 Tax=Trichomonas vaginalis (strain ATCC PRA-98 / G3) TaxID=412133 RepID=A2D9D8_TRIV3|nr:hypothetical protein TVAGG3_0479460 [Trichomonas vaginalis G3]EAY23164.1 hypothetical protein TVAG_184020 [Trichomonas vaginalis G3]KAI5515595.1 hypothetical protein TVAGG3_0479460 [Trichomonas vaginalis G3]|eukprot:XP_001584150.1 hypothetical protein [Trichomonas vaginalis G3]